MEKAQTNLLSAKQLALDGMLTALLIIMGMIKLPSLIPGAEFQLSAPYAVCLAAIAGFKRYLRIGVCASIIQLLLGTHTIWNVLIAMVFRIAVGLVITLFPGNKAAFVLAGPVGTSCARLVLAAILHVFAGPLLAAAFPGMVFTAVCAAVLNPVLTKIFSQSQDMAYAVKK